MVSEVSVLNIEELTAGVTAGQGLRISCQFSQSNACSLWSLRNLGLMIRVRRGCCGVPGRQAVAVELRIGFTGSEGVQMSFVRCLQSCCCFLLLLQISSSPAAERPNVVLIMADDLGYADLSCCGGQVKTPHLDRLAQQGTRFTDFYVAQAVCTASRAALMTGCYPNRVGLQGALNHTSQNGIHPSEWLLPEMLREQGYATAIFGKWHLGTAPQFNPLRHGFDEWLGIPYSNDNSRYHPVLASEMPPLPLYDGESVIEQDPDQSQFTKRFTERSVGFIRRNVNRPFFLYVPHVMPHVPIFASERFRGKSGVGLYGDVIQELDWSVGEILAELDRLQLSEKTLVLFCSDNGAWLSYGEHAGSNGRLREGKLTAFEGGVRVPCLVRWTGHVPAGQVSDVPWMAIDLLPTLAALTGGKLPKHRFDGVDVSGLLSGKDRQSAPHESLFFYAGTELHAVRSGPWKLHFPHSYITTLAEPGRGGKPSGWGSQQARSITQSGIDGIASRHGGKVVPLELSLFHLQDDPGETVNVAAQHPEIVRRLSQLADPVRQDLGDSLLGIAGQGLRPVGQAP